MKGNRAVAKKWKYAFVFAPDVVDDTIRTNTPARLKIYESHARVKVKE